MEQRGFLSQMLANALGTLLAVAVIYLAGVLAGVFTGHTLLVVGSLLLLFGVAQFMFGLGLLARAGWATRLLPRWVTRRLDGRRRDDDD